LRIASLRVCRAGVFSQARLPAAIMAVGTARQSFTERFKARSKNARQRRAQAEIFL
jgi:hypothetical protein